jgi:transaldolase
MPDLTKYPYPLNEDNYPMKNSPLTHLTALGQSIWLDYIRRDLITTGELRRLIEEDCVRGMTSNPSIFEKAINNDRIYNDEIRSLASRGMNATAIYETIVRSDIQMAADEFRPLYDKTDGTDGYVSLEVNPHLAHDTNGTIAEARRLWKTLDRPNVFIKVPATAEGLPAITRLIHDGININVTLLFGLQRYRQVARAYISGIEARLEQGDTVTRVVSVASFFLSRIDTLVDGLIDKKISAGGADAVVAKQLHGRIALASANAAYRIYKEIFESEPFSRLADSGARTQRLLWASTATKNPEYSDIKYIEGVIGPHTINTMPPETLNAFRDHGTPEALLGTGAAEAAGMISQLESLGISIDEITRQLEDEGVEKFIEPFDKLMKALAQ